MDGAAVWAVLERGGSVAFASAAELAARLVASCFEAEKENGFARDILAVVPAGAGPNSGGLVAELQGWGPLGAAAL